ncbi:MAG: DUF1501 domain-containing protein [Chitinophagaceae bacterium]|nr:DUF1501 domain-containing protein [Chitinophagaceae bacterium]
MKRRQFLENTIPAAILPSLIDGTSVKVLAHNPIMAAMLNTYVESDRALVIVQLSGGNDGLNMVIPLDQYSNYFNARSNIAIPQNRVLPLTGNTTTGLHPSMTGLQSMYNEGKVRLVQAVGYPNPNFSHFRATDIWMSASDSNVEVTSGWSGRYLSDQYPNYPVGYPNTPMPDPLGIQIGSSTSLTFQGPSVNMGISITSATNFYNLINGIQDPAPATPAGDALKYVRLVAQQSNQYSARIVAAANAVPTQGTYPTNNSLADQLKIVARLIKGGLKTRVYMVSFGSFDTHSIQTNTADTTTGTHATLLQRVSAAIKAFQDDIKNLGVEDRVLGMTFSEFGRRIKSNASVGTDHGAAAPLFVFGKKVNPGITGVNPTIPVTATVNDNVVMQYDFRSVYSSILQDWFCVDNTTLQTIMLQNFQKLPVCANGTCLGPTAVTTRDAGVSLVSNYPNPFTETTTIKFTTAGGHTLIQVMDSLGRVIRTPVDRDYVAGTYNVTFDSYGLPTGVYYVRFQNGITQQVKPMLKAR